MIVGLLAILARNRLAAVPDAVALVGCDDDSIVLDGTVANANAARASDTPQTIERRLQDLATKHPP